MSFFAGSKVDKKRADDSNNKVQLTGSKCPHHFPPARKVQKSDYRAEVYTQHMIISATSAPLLRESFALPPQEINS